MAASKPVPNRTSCAWAAQCSSCRIAVSLSFSSRCWVSRVVYLLCGFTSTKQSHSSVLVSAILAKQPVTLLCTGSVGGNQGEGCCSIAIWLSGSLRCSYLRCGHCSRGARLRCRFGSHSHAKDQGRRRCSLWKGVYSPAAYVILSGLQLARSFLASRKKLGMWQARAA